MSFEQMEEALLRADTIEKITIEFVEGRQFIWRVFSEGREIVTMQEEQHAVADMLQCCEVLINTELGVDESILRQPLLN